MPYECPMCKKCCEKITGNENSCPSCKIKIQTFIFNRELNNEVNSGVDLKPECEIKKLVHVKELLGNTPFKPNSVDSIKLVIEFKEKYGCMSHKDIMLVTKYMKKTCSYISNAINHLYQQKSISSKYLMFAQYCKIKNDTNCDQHGAKVSQFKYAHVIDFWNMVNDGMDQCYNMCTGIQNLTIKSSQDIKFVLDSKISSFGNCCNLRNYLKN